MSTVGNWCDILIVLVDEESDSDSEVSLASDESEGLSWDELEKKAANVAPVLRGALW